MSRPPTHTFRTRLSSGAAAWAIAVALTASGPLAAHAQVAGERIPGETDATFYDGDLVRSGLFDRTTDVGVLERLRAELAVNPIDLGSFSLFPAIRAAGAYNSNVLAISHGDADEAFRVEPSIALQSNWGRNYASAFARLDNWTWASHTNEDVTNYAIGTKDRLDIGQASGVALGAEFASLTEARDDLPSPQGAVKPEHYNLASGYIGVVHQFNRLRLVAHADVKDFTYDNNRDALGNLIYQSDRNLLQFNYEGRAEYAVNAVASVYVQLGGNTRSYRDALVGEPTRNSSGFDVALGANFDLTHLMRGDVQLGYLDQSFDSKSFRPVSGLAVRGSLAYLLSPLTTITLTSTQNVGDAGVVGSAGYLQTTQRLQIDHEFSRSIIASVDAGAEEDSIRDISRRDFRPYAGASARFVINRSLGFVLNYQYFRDKSSGALQGPTYDEQKLIVTLIYQL